MKKNWQLKQKAFLAQTNSPISRLSMDELKQVNGGDGVQTMDLASLNLQRGRDC